MVTADLLNAIDERVRRVQQENRALGTVAEVTGLVDALVTFDGSSLAIPVKVFGDVSIVEGDRVGLERYGVWWIVTGTLTRRWPASNGLRKTQSTGGTTTSGTYGNTPDVAEFTFVKRWDTTNITVKIFASGYTDVADTRIEMGVKATETSTAVTSTVDICRLRLNPANTHLHFGGIVPLAGYAAGTYLLRAQWKRSSGTGTLHMDGEDQVFIGADETSP